MLIIQTYTGLVFVANIYFLHRLLMYKKKSHNIWILTTEPGNIFWLSFVLMDYLYFTLS